MLNSKKRTLLFDTTGLELTFDQLSGGEREIARKGRLTASDCGMVSFLLDEPELHLNADLIRAWIAYLTGTFATGQIWLATHSLEAVEAAGQKATFVLERNEANTIRSTVLRVSIRAQSSRLYHARLARPLFQFCNFCLFLWKVKRVLESESVSVSLLACHRTSALWNVAPGNEVLRRVTSIKAIASESQVGIRIGGVVDRDFRSDADSNALNDDYGVFVLPVHEVENYFLHPATLDVLLQQNGRGAVRSRSISSARLLMRVRGAGIFQYAMGTRNAKALPEMSAAAKELAKRTYMGPDRR